MNCYLWIPSADITSSMANRIQPYLIKTQTINSIDYGVSEISRNNLVQTTLFDSYVWYSRKQALTIKDTGVFPT